MKLDYRGALRDALRHALANDERCFLMGEDVGAYGGCFAVSLGLMEEFGEDRVRDTPLSESAFVGAGIGAAMGGVRPIVEIMTVNFSLLALDQILNNAATYLHMSGGQFAVPLVIRMTTGAGRQLAAQHSHSLEGWYAHIPGIRVVAPATVADARGMLWTALADPDPVAAFTARAAGLSVGTSVERVADMAELPAAVRRYLDRQGLPARIALQPAPRLLALDWSGIAVHASAAADEPVGVGLARWGIAESGSLVLHSGPDNPVLLSFLPLHHIVAVRAASILPHLEDYAALAAPAPRNANLITGASGTTDIEGSYVRGAHGPGFLHVVIVERET